MKQAFEAMAFAMEVHKDQKRKYTGEPYFGHLAEVAGIVSVMQHEFMVPTDVILSTAWLHDCVEDQGVTRETLEEKFGPMVAAGVMLLSDLEEGTRAERKAASRERLSMAPAWVQSIKCADLISNTKSIVLHDQKFAVTYLEEKRLLLEVLTRADARLLAMAKSFL